jgi:hypothetical protein
VREDERGKKKGGDGNGAPFIGDTAGSGGRSAGGATRRRGVGEGHGASVAVGQHGVANSGPAMAHTPDRRRNRGEAMLTSGPWRFEYNSNSNELKLLQNLPNFD